jgi:hypothetical protein
VLNLDPLEFLGYLTPLFRYWGKLKIIFNSDTTVHSKILSF